MALTNAQIRRAMKKMRVNNNDVVLINSKTEIAEHIEQVVQVLNDSGRTNVVIIVCDNFDDLKSIPENEMFKHGWIRRERLKKLIHAPGKVLKPEEYHEDGN